MPTGNPLEQLRRRMQSHASPTAFAALAEEHRRAGRLAEAVAVCRAGLERYPAYVSGRVTLGRALLDSGDAVGAVAELEHAVAQSPDNLAAARALDTARAALGHAPRPPATVAPAAADLPLRRPAVATMATAPPPGTRTRDAGPHGPEAFGPGPAWVLPDTLPPLPEAAAPAPAAPSDAVPDTANGANDFSWFLDAPSAGVLDEQAVAEQSGPEAELTSAWAAPAIDRTVAMMPAPDVEVIAASPAEVQVITDAVPDDEGTSFWEGSYGESVAEAPAPFAAWDDETPSTTQHADQSPWADQDIADAMDTWSTPDGPSATWALSDLEAAGADPTPFQGTLDVEDTLPFPFAGFVETAGWSDPSAEASTSPLTKVPSDVPALPPAAVLVDAPASWLADSEPWQGLPPGSGLESFPAEPSTGTSKPPMCDTPADAAEPLPAEAAANAPEPLRASTDPVPAVEAWSGSVRSALGEVFALAGHGDSLEPPGHPSATVRDAMADTAVDAAIEDAARCDDAPPTRASLEQMLAAVRARRAALSGSLGP